MSQTFVREENRLLRVVFSLLAVALAFAALTFELNLGRDAEANARAAALIFVGVLGHGYPLLCHCCRRGWWQLWRMVLLGAFTGLLCTLPFLNGPYGQGILLFTYLVFGTVMGLLFWLAADVFLLIFTGVVVAVSLRGLSQFVSRHTPLSDG